MIEANAEILMERTQVAASLNSDLTQALREFIQTRAQLTEPVPDGWGSTMTNDQKQRALDSLTDKAAALIAQRALVDEAWTATDPI